MAITLPLKKLSFFIILFIGYSGIAQNYGKITYSQAINISGKQRMLSQKITKVYLLQQKNGKSAETEAEFKSALGKFNKNLITLEENASGASQEVKDAIAVEKKQWEQFLQVFMFRTKESMDKVVTTSTELLKKCHALVLKIKADAESKSKGGTSLDLDKIETVNISGKQRMLSQRSAMLYIACDIDNTSKACGILKEVISEIKSTYSKLSTSKYNNDEINPYFNTVKTLLGKIEEKTASQGAVKDLASLSNELTKTYNKITQLYAK